LAVRSLIVGTAGHIDHGKSALVRALTGTDPDRLKEEKERGITIDLGFAHMDVGPERVVSFIDVPGHERFVRNMLAGAHGIDAVLLVIAADESVMPQTREHFQICRLLGIDRGLVVLTKCDLADEEMQALAEIEARELAAGSFLEGAPVLRVSAVTGQGLAGLRAALDSLAAAPPSRPAGGLLRLPLDRAFTLRGFGTVVTGTLVSGTLVLGEEVEVLPSGRRARVRGLHVHGSAVARVEAGNRAAVNLAGLDVADLTRGDVLARPGTLRPSSILDVELTLLPGERPLKDQARVRVHVMSGEYLARVRVLGGSAVAPGTTAPVQLRLERPAVAGRGDPLIVRSYSPAMTIGGALVVDPLAPKKRGHGAAPRPSGRSLASGDAVLAAVALVEEAGPQGIDAPRLAARVTAPLETLMAALAAQPAVLAFGREPAWLVARTALESLASSARDVLARYHATQPLKASMPREELRRRAFAGAAPGVFEQVLGDMAGAGELRAAADGVALATHAVRLSPEEAAARGALIDAARAAGLEGLDLSRGEPPARLEPRLADRVSRLLVAEGVLRRVGDALVSGEALDGLKADVRRRWASGARLDVAEFKDLTRLSRKYVIPLLEYLDREKITRRSGADRVVM
jgi:selenocysteine-specific elongation factor